MPKRFTVSHRGRASGRDAARPGRGASLRRRLRVLRLRLDGDLAAALALARVLPRAAVVAGLAAAHRLARVLALALVLGFRRGAAALALARVHPGAAVVRRFAPALALALVVALADVLGGLVLGVQARAGEHLRPRDQTRRHRAHRLRELTTLHALASCIREL